MKMKQGQTQPINLTTEELKAVRFALELDDETVADIKAAEPEWAQDRTIIEGVLDKVNDLLNEGIQDGE